MATETSSQQHTILKGYNMLLYFAGTMIMYEPSEECISDFWKEGILRKLPVSSTNPAFIRAASQLRESCSDESSSIASMSEDYNKLFTGADEPLAPVYESFYINPGQTGSLSTEADVSEFYNSYGWKINFRPERKDDHLGVELMFLTKLIDKYLILDDEACRSEMISEIRRFIGQHILSWIPEWNRRVQEHAATLSYKGISSLIYACMEDIYSIFSNSKDPFSRSGYLRN